VSLLLSVSLGALLQHRSPAPSCQRYGGSRSHNRGSALPYDTAAPSGETPRCASPPERQKGNIALQGNAVHSSAQLSVGIFPVLPGALCFNGGVSQVGKMGYAGNKTWRREDGSWMMLTGPFAARDLYPLVADLRRDRLHLAHLGGKCLEVPNTDRHVFPSPSSSRAREMSPKASCKAGGDLTQRGPVRSMYVHVLSPWRVHNRIRFPVYCARVVRQSIFRNGDVSPSAAVRLIERRSVVTIQNTRRPGRPGPRAGLTCTAVAVARRVIVYDWQAGHVQLG
jgi:hypothetical protein